MALAAPFWCSPRSSLAARRWSPRVFSSTGYPSGRRNPLNCIDGNKAMKPCPCGYLGDENGSCHCTIDQVTRYASRISGPLLDRIDIQIDVPRIDYFKLRRSDQLPESSSSVRTRVIDAFQRQRCRQGVSNAHLNEQQLRDHCSLTDEDEPWLEKASRKLKLSPRSFTRILKVARTVADLAGSDNINRTHLGEAVGYRSLDRRHGPPR